MKKPRNAPKGFTPAEINAACEKLAAYGRERYKYPNPQFRAVNDGAWHVERCPTLEEYDRGVRFDL
jgi:hypothetical protein